MYWLSLNLQFGRRKRKKVYFIIVQPNLACHIGLVGILGFTILLHHGDINTYTHLVYTKCGTVNTVHLGINEGLEKSTNGQILLLEHQGWWSWYCSIPPMFLLFLPWIMIPTRPLLTPLVPHNDIYLWNSTYAYDSTLYYMIH